MRRSMLLAAVAATLISTGCQSARTASGPPASAAVAGADRVFEMRTYTTHPGRLPALEARFRNHTMRLFERHGMTNVGYWIPQDSARRDNTLIYILAYPSREAARASWEGFRNDPEWRQVAAASEADGRIVSRVESVFMTPADYSPIR